MAESKGGLFGKAFQKRVVRAKEKVLQNLGKADKTTDEIFDEHVNNFSRQQTASAKLQKELKNYIACARAMYLASKSMYETLEETYEPDWVEKQKVHQIVQNLDLLWNDYLQKLNDEVAAPLQTYINRFPELRAKISKRGRKLVDYDSARHNLETVENAKKRDESKIQKAMDQLNEAKRTYEDMNNELHNELPAMYDSRIIQYCTATQSLVTAGNIFGQESAKLQSQYSDVIEDLARENSKGTYNAPRASDAGRSRGSTKSSKSSSDEKLDSSSEKLRKSSQQPADDHSDRSSNSSANKKQPEPARRASGNSDEEQEISLPVDGSDVEDNTNDVEPAISNEDVDKAQTDEEDAKIEPKVDEESVKLNGTPDSDDKSSVEAEPSHKQDASSSSSDKKVNGQLLMQESDITQEESAYDTAYEPTTAADDMSYEPVDVGAQRKSNAINDSEYVEFNDDTPPKIPQSEKPEKPEQVAVYSTAEDIDEYQVPPSNAPVAGQLPAGVLYQVKATHPYNGEDDDELSFESGEVINVIPFDDPEDQDEGWLMGIKVSNGKEGVFPANFTKPM